MAELILHDLDSTLMQRLADLAARTGRTVEQEAKLMLEESLVSPRSGLSRRHSESANHTAGHSATAPN